MAKNVVVCCDGTANEFKEDRTNVVKLFSMLVQDPARQVAYYIAHATIVSCNQAARLGRRPQLRCGDPGRTAAGDVVHSPADARSPHVRAVGAAV